MRLTKQKIEDIFKDIIGADVLPVVEFLYGKKNISEYDIVGMLNLNIKDVRKILYRMHTKNMATYYRKKDRIKGYYISYWTLYKRGILEAVEKEKFNRINVFEERLLREIENVNSFYLCPNMCLRMDFDDAADNNFHCSECGSIMLQQDNTKTIEQLKEKIKQLKTAA